MRGEFPILALQGTHFALFLACLLFFMCCQFPPVPWKGGWIYFAGTP